MSEPDMLFRSVCIAGGGNAAHVMAGLLSSAGKKVRMFLPVGGEAKAFEKAGGTLTVVQKDMGKPDAVGKIERVSADAKDVVPGSDLVIVAAPAFAFRPLLKSIVPHLAPEAVLGAIPGQGGFHWVLHDVAQSMGIKERFTLFTMIPLPYNCRIIKFGESVNLIGRKDHVVISVHPTSKAAEVSKAVDEALLVESRTVPDLLAITLTPSNALLHSSILYGLFHDWHPGVVYPKSPLFYEELTPLGAETLAAMDAELRQIVQAWDAKMPDRPSLAKQVPSLKDYLIEAYGKEQIADTSTIASVISTCKAFFGLGAPMREAKDEERDGTLPDDQPQLVPNFGNRYFSEDLPFGLFLVRSVGTAVDVKTPTMDKVLLWAQHFMRKEYLTDDGTIDGHDAPDSGCPQRYGLKTLQEIRGDED